MNFVRNGQLFATFCTTSCQYATAIGSKHTLTETMLVVSLTIVGLECSFHFCYAVFCFWYTYHWAGKVSTNHSIADLAASLFYWGTFSLRVAKLGKLLWMSKICYMKSCIFRVAYPLELKHEDYFCIKCFVFKPISYVLCFAFVKSFGLFSNQLSIVKVVNLHSASYLAECFGSNGTSLFASFA